jgi:perosamine synthetase
MDTESPRQTFLPFARPDMDQEDIDLVVDALRSGWLSKGPRVLEFEKRLGEFIDAPHVVACSSCTAALHLALLVSNIGPGDEVIVPSFTFCASANVIVHVGATPVFADIDEGTFCIDVADVRSKITPRTKAVIAVHYGGYPADLDGLKEVCTEHGLILIEDAAHAMGTKYANEWIGKHGDFVCFSFYATKALTTGEGGALLTRDDGMAELARLYSSHGMSNGAWNRYGQTGSWRYEVTVPGFKYNMTDPQAALGLTQLAKLHVTRQKREEIAHYYRTALESLKGAVILPKDVEGHGNQHSWHLFPIRITPEFGMDRDAFIEGMKAMNIGTSVHFIPVHMHPYYGDRFAVRLAVTERVFAEIVSLPIYSQMTEAEAGDVVRTVRQLHAAAAYRVPAVGYAHRGTVALTST